MLVNISRVPLRTNVQFTLVLSKQQSSHCIPLWCNLCSNSRVCLLVCYRCCHVGVTTCFNTAQLGFGPMEKAVAESVEAVFECVCAAAATHTHTVSVSGSSVLLQGCCVCSDGGLKTRGGHTLWHKGPTAKKNIKKDMHFFKDSTSTDLYLVFVIVWFLCSFVQQVWLVT